MRTLNVISGPAQGETLELDRELVLGREGADLTIADPEMSRRHVALRPVDGGVEVEDLGSMNGTFVDGRRIADPVTMTVSGKLKVGNTQIEVEVALPQVTKASEQLPDIPTVDVTRASQVPQPPPAPDVTAPRKLPEPPPRPQQAPPEPEQAPPAPDVTAPRGMPTPDVTAPRKVAQPPPELGQAPPAPDVTAPRKTPPPPPPATAPPVSASPDVTAPRRVPAPPPQEAPGGRPDGPPIGRLIGIAVAVIVVVLILVFALAARGEGTEEHAVNMSGSLKTTSRVRNNEVSSGPVAGDPAGRGRATLDASLGGPPSGS